MTEEQAERHIAALLLVNGHLELQAGFSGGQRHDENCRWQKALADNLGRFDKGFSHHFQFAPATAWQHGENRVIAGQRELLADRLLAGLQRDDIGQWMPDVGHRDTLFLVNLRFHREQCKQTIDRPADLLDPPTAPGPDRWADIMDRAYAGRLEIGFQTEIEIVCIDADEDIRPQIKQAPLQLATNTGDLAEML